MHYRFLKRYFFINFKKCSLNWATTDNPIEIRLSHLASNRNNLCRKQQKMLTKTYWQKPHCEEFAQFVWIWVPQKENMVFIRKTLTIAGIIACDVSPGEKGLGEIKACNIPIKLTLWWITAGTSTCRENPTKFAAWMIGCKLDWMTNICCVLGLHKVHRGPNVLWRRN